jgi:hypothetical protein
MTLLHEVSCKYPKLNNLFRIEGCIKELRGLYVLLQNQENSQAQTASKPVGRFELYDSDTIPKKKSGLNKNVCYIFLIM